MRLQLLLGLSLLLFCSSCATILNRPTTRVRIQTDAPATIAIDGRNLPTNKRNRVSFFVDRSSEDLNLEILTDSTRKEIGIRAINSDAYILNFLYSFGVGALIERDNPKRFAYPRRLYIPTTESNKNYFKNSPFSRKGNWYVHFSIPYINGFYQQPFGETEFKANGGFLGLSGGIDYYYNHHQYLSFKASAVTDFSFPIPAPVTYDGEYEVMNSLYISLTQNHQFSFYSIGYGLTFGENSWNFNADESFGPTPVGDQSRRIASQFIGFELPQYVQFGGNFHLGLLYRPSFYQFGQDAEGRFRYEHLISLDLAWKIPL